MNILLCYSFAAVVGYYSLITTGLQRHQKHLLFKYFDCGSVNWTPDMENLIKIHQEVNSGPKKTKTLLMFSYTVSDTIMSILILEL